MLAHISEAPPLANADLNGNCIPGPSSLLLSILIPTASPAFTLHSLPPRLSLSRAFTLVTSSLSLFSLSRGASSSRGAYVHNQLGDSHLYIRRFPLFFFHSHSIKMPALRERKRMLPPKDARRGRSDGPYRRREREQQVKLVHFK